MADELKTRITIEADDAIRLLKQVADLESQLAQKTEEAGEKAKVAAEESRKMGSVLADVEKNLIGMTQAFLSFVAIKSAIVDTINLITEKAREANAEVAKLSRETGGLAANIGGKLSGEAVSIIGGVSADAGFSPADDRQLRDFVAAMSDMREVTTKGQIGDLARSGAMLQKATGGAFAGQEGAEAIQMAVSRLGISDDAAVNLLSTMGNSGFDAPTVKSMIGKGADLDILSMMLAARGSGLTKGDTGRKMDSLLGSVLRVNDEGEVADDLSALGITGSMKASERIAHLVKGGASGQISSGQLFAATGGQTVQSLLNAITPSILNTGAIDAARSELTSPDSARSAISQRMSNPFAQAETIENLRLLREQARKIRDGQSEYAMGVSNFDDGGINFLGIPSLGRALAGAFTTPEDVAAMPKRHSEDIKGFLGLNADQPRGQPGGVVNNITNIINSNLTVPPDRLPSPAQQQP